MKFKCSSAVENSCLKLSSICAFKELRPSVNVHSLLATNCWTCD